MRHLTHTRKRVRCGASHRSCLELLEQRTVLSAVPFGDPQLIAEADPQFFDVYAADLDGDNDLDTLVANFRENRIAWYPNTDGAGTFGSQQVITEQAVGAEAVHAADLDGDGDLDVLSASSWSRYGEYKVAWYENLDGAGNFGPQQILNDNAVGAAWVFAADLDSDGDLDVVSADNGGYGTSNPDGKIAWYENDGAGNFAQEIVITVAPRASVDIADIDSDGDLDLVASTYRWNGDPFDIKLIWCENDGAGNFGPQQVIAESNLPFKTIHASDLDGDGDLDLVATSNRSTSYASYIYWYENDGQGGFERQSLIAQTRRHDTVLAIDAADLDDDGDHDLVVAFSDGWTGGGPVAWYENVDGEGGFGPQRVINERDSRVLFVGDLDGDGDPDVLGDREWYENADGVGNFGPERIIGPGRRLRNTLSADLDGDNDLDVVAWEGNDVTWNENTNGTGSFGEQRLIDRLDDHVQSVTAADLDGDGDLDLLGVTDTKIIWYENIGGAGEFGPRQVIYRYGDGLDSWTLDAIAADLDSDGDLDLLANTGTWESAWLSWFENDGAGNFGPARLIGSTRSWVTISTPDLDGDGDLDVLVRESRQIAWYENRDGAGTFGPRRAITSEKIVSPESTMAADLDGDGDLDVLAVVDRTCCDVNGLSIFDPRIIWYENTDGAGRFGPERLIAKSSRSELLSFAGDLDGDGDLDVLTRSRETNSDPYTVAWYENTDGAGTFGPASVVLKTVERPYSLYAEDLDGDRDLDVLVGTFHQIIWSENLQAHPGDANRDGVFTSTDLVEVFKAGEYEDGVPENSTWEEGDWNGDREFDSGDLVLAFKEGLYEFKSRVLASEIAAAVDWLFSNDESMKRGKAYVA